jgi:hypothetical protein
MTRTGLPTRGRLENSRASVLAVATWPSLTTRSMVPVAYKEREGDGGADDGGDGRCRGREVEVSRGKGRRGKQTRCRRARTALRACACRHACAADRDGAGDVREARRPRYGVVVGR